MSTARADLTASQFAFRGPFEERDGQVEGSDDAAVQTTGAEEEEAWVEPASGSSGEEEEVRVEPAGDAEQAEQVSADPGDAGPAASDPQAESAPAPTAAELAANPYVSHDCDATCAREQYDGVPAGTYTEPVEARV